MLEGWYTEETLKNRYTFDEPVTANIMLFAKWKLKDEKHGCDMFTDMELRMRYASALRTAL